MRCWHCSCSRCSCATSTCTTSGREVMRARLELVLSRSASPALTYLLRAVRWQYLLAPLGHVGLGNAFRTTLSGSRRARAAGARRRGHSAVSARAQGRPERHGGLRDDHPRARARHGDGAAAVRPSSCCSSTPTSRAATRSPSAGSRSAARVAAVVSVVALVVLFVLAGHPRTLGSTAGCARARAAGALAASGDAAPAHVRERAGDRAAAGPAAGGAAAVVPALAVDCAGIWCVSRAFHIDLPFTGSFLLMALLVVGVAVPTPGAVGGFHDVYRLAATTFFGAPNDRAVGAAIVLHAVSVRAGGCCRAGLAGAGRAEPVAASATSLRTDGAEETA